MRAHPRRRCSRPPASGMIADVPLGAFLSGGIDSSAVVAAMAQQSTEPVRTFSIGFDHAGVRRAPARAPDRASSSAPSTRSSRSARDAVEILPKIVRHYGEPFADSSAIPSFYLSELTRRHVTVALNGDGGDESFGGYTRYVANALAGAPRPASRAALRRALGALGGTAARGRRHLERRATARAASPATLRARRPRAATRSYMAWFDAGAAARALHARVRGRSRRRRRTTRSRAAWAADVGRVGHRPDARGRRRHLPRRRPDPEDRHRDDGARPRGALAVPRPRADAARRVDPGGAEGARLARRSGSCARRCAAWLPGRPPRPAQAGLLGAAVAPGCATDLRELGARDPARPARRSSAATSAPTRSRRCSTATRRGVDADDQRIWSLLMLELWHREFVDVRPAGLRHAA